MFSIIVPCHNEELFVPTLIQSLEKQTRADLIEEVIIVDNASRDKTKSVTLTLASQGPLQIQYVPEAQLGVSRARNTGARQATADYFIFLDADNLVSPLMIENMANMIDKGVKACTIRNLSQTPLWTAGGVAFLSLEAIKSFFYKPFGKSMVHRDLYSAAKGFNENISLGENVEFLLKVKSHCRKSEFGHCKSPVYSSVRRFKQQGYYSVLRPWLTAYMGNYSLIYPTVCSFLDTKKSQTKEPSAASFSSPTIH